MGGIRELIEWLSRETKGGVVDLRYANGRWCVMVAQANSMRVVPGSSSEDPIDSLNATIARWENRSPESPF